MGHTEAKSSQNEVLLKELGKFIFSRIVSVIIYPQDHSEVIFISDSNLGLKVSSCVTEVCISERCPTHWR